MSSTLSYTHAKSILSEVEKDRIVCTYLNSTEPNAVDWDKATAEYGAASVESYKKGMSNTAKKIKKSMDSGVVPEAADATDATPAKKSGGKKRKEKAVEADAEAEAETEESPTKKKRGRKSKAQKAAEAVAAAAEDGEGVKDESE